MERRQVIGLLVLVRIISWEERLLISTCWYETGSFVSQIRWQDQGLGLKVGLMVPLMAKAAVNDHLSSAFSQTTINPLMLTSWLV